MLAEALKGEEKSVEEIFSERNLAGLGDTYINFLYSLAFSLKKKKPCGMKVSNKVLAEAVRQAGVRRRLPSRLSRRDIGSSAEALIVYAAAKNLISSRELVDLLREAEDPVSAFSQALTNIWTRAGLHLPRRKAEG
jgi:hypothetical protein